jgi:hypothetical protein
MKLHFEVSLLYEVAKKIHYFSKKKKKKTMDKLTNEHAIVDK